MNPSQQIAGFALGRGEVQVAEAVLVHKRELFCTYKNLEYTKLTKNRMQDSASNVA